MQKELKPLIASLQELQYGDYLLTDSFSSSMLENDMDELWAAALKIANEYDDIYYTGNSLVFESAFVYSADNLWIKNKDLFFKFITVSVESLIKNTKNREYSKLYRYMIDLEFPTKNMESIKSVR